MIKTIGSLLLLSILFLNLYSQQDTILLFHDINSAQDTIVLNMNQDSVKRNPLAAIIFSASIPGLGQIYNQKYLKVPFIYAGLAASYYYVDYFNYFYQVYRNDLINLSLDSNYIPTSGITSMTQLTQNYYLYRRKRDLAVIAGAVVWILNIVDAYVDAELSDFDISPDLSLKISPNFWISPKQEYAYGLSFSFVF